MGKNLKHYGTPRKSGRYPWGSGDDGYQRNTSFQGYVKTLRDQGLSDLEIARGMGITTTQLRERISIAKAEKRAADAATAQKLRDKGYSKVAIGEKMGINESSVRSLLNPAIKEKSDIAAMTASVLKDNVEKKDYIDIGSGVESHLGISRTKLNTAVAMLVEEGYTVHRVQTEQVGTGNGKKTTIKVLAKPGTSFSEVYKNREKIKTISDYSEDGGRSFLGLEPIRNVDSSRILVKYAEDGGASKDGVIELRRGVPDISLGNAKYAQVRVGVDGSHYMKGMAMYSDNIPDGYDIIYNTNKPKGSSKDKVFKPMKDDPDNPFGSTVRQRHYIDEKGNSQLSALNVIGRLPGSGEEGSWDTWSKTLSSQVLSKQSTALAKKQLDLALGWKKDEYDEIMSLTNPAIKRALLSTFADEADADAVHLKGAALPRQNNRVLLPIPSMKENEVYAPDYRDGEPVVLIRHPHGGTFEIPELIVNNRNREAKSVMGNAKDAIGINPKVAQRLSGADFDGDTVLVVPNASRAIKTSRPLKGLEDFDPKTQYKEYPGMKPLSPQGKQLKMGDVSNLITDMTIKGADPDEIARAVRHSMVVIDAEKHKLNYRQSYLDNNIADLKKKYQGSERSGASTLISRASSETRVPERREGKIILDPRTGKKRRLYIDPETGEKLYEETGKTYLRRNARKIKDPITGETKKIYYDVDPETGERIFFDKEGTQVKRLIKIPRMAKEKDAYALSSGTIMESIYAEHANSLKRLANQARKSLVETEQIPYSPSARVTYSREVASLKAQLALANRNKPLERQAQLIANKTISAKRHSNPDMTPEELKKIKGQALDEARHRVGAKKQSIQISDREWEAIQAGALSTNSLYRILSNTDLNALKKRALPKSSTGLGTAKRSRARSMLSLGYTRGEIADALGVSVSTLNKALE